MLVQPELAEICRGFLILLSNARTPPVVEVLQNVGVMRGKEVLATLGFLIVRSQNWIVRWKLRLDERRPGALVVAVQGEALVLNISVNRFAKGGGSQEPIAIVRRDERLDITGH
jgi:hypothetical protein